MKITCVGDSLTEGDYGIPGKTGIANIHAENYPFFLSQIVDAEVVNAGRCGYTSLAYLRDYEQMSPRIADADIVIVMLGTNGGMQPKGLCPENVAYSHLLGRIAADAPNATVVLCTPPYATDDPSYSNCGYLPQVEQAVAFVRSFARRKRYALIDVAECPDFGPGKEPVMQPNDGLHCTETGYRVMAEYIAAGLRRLGLIG